MSPPCPPPPMPSAPLNPPRAEKFRGKVRTDQGIYDIFRQQEEAGYWEMTDSLIKVMGMSIDAVSQQAAVLTVRGQFWDMTEADIERILTTCLVIELIDQSAEYLEKTPASSRGWTKWLIQPTKVRMACKKRLSTNGRVWRSVAERHMKAFSDTGVRIIRGQAAAMIQEHMQNGLVQQKNCQFCGGNFSAQRSSCPDCVKGRDVVVSSTCVDAGYDFPFADLTPAKDIHSISWKDAKGVHWCRGGLGSLGAFFVQVGQEIVVVKSGGKAPAAEYFGSLLLEAVGRKTPATRVLASHGEEGDVLYGGVRPAPFTTLNENYRAWDLRKYSTILVMEYVPDARELCMPQEDFTTLRSVGGGQLWKELGAIAASDMLINNADRVPVIWNNLGNAANFLIHSTADAVTITAIDQTVVPIKQGPRREAYFERVECTLRQLGEALADPLGSDSPALQAVRDGPLAQVDKFLTTYAATTMTKEEFHLFASSLYKQSQHIATAMTQDLLSKLKEKIRADFSDDAFFDVSADLFVPIEDTFVDEALRAIVAGVSPPPDASPSAK